MFKTICDKDRRARENVLQVGELAKDASKIVPAPKDVHCNMLLIDGSENHDKDIDMILPAVAQVVIGPPLLSTDLPGEEVENRKVGILRCAVRALQKVGRVKFAFTPQ